MLRHSSIFCKAHSSAAPCRHRRRLAHALRQVVRRVHEGRHDRPFRVGGAGPAQQDKARPQPHQPPRLGQRRHADQRAQLRARDHHRAVAAKAHHRALDVHGLRLGPQRHHAGDDAHRGRPRRRRRRRRLGLRLQRRAADSAPPRARPRAVRLRQAEGPSQRCPTSSRRRATTRCCGCRRRRRSPSARRARRWAGTAT